ncbi:MAG: hypothetical protein NWP90_06155 [Flavobacterium sp.]|nr:hypothetical protein [Flavobacterium sp.]
MMKLKFLLFSTLVFLLSCTNKEDSILKLKWNKSYDNETKVQAETGLKWALSYIGASILNNDNIHYNLGIVSLDVSKMGFSKNAEKSLIKIHQKIKESEEYRTNHSIDLGRYISLLLGSSEHYYALTEIPYNLEDITKNYSLKLEKAYINNSDVSKEHRIIQFSEQNGFNQLFISQEIDSIKGKIYEFETLELMKNGQIRFGIFDANGNRKIAADSKHTNAGKPAKCIWCHESSIQPLFSDQQDKKGYLSLKNLQETLETYRKINIDLKIKVTDTLNHINYERTQDHTFTEILYTGFMEPSAKRLALEWNMSEMQVKTKLKNYKTHQHHEFVYLGELYHRNEIEHLAPLKSIPVSGNIREKSNQEVNYLQ